MTGRPVIYSGQGFSPKGDKDRYVLPASFRRTVTESSADKNLLLVSKHEKWNCLIGYGASRRDGLLAEIDRDYQVALGAGQPFDRDLRYFQLFDCTEISFDNSGRFVIPAHLKKLVGSTGSIFIQGSGPFFTLWSPDVLAAQEGPQWASAQAACASMVDAEPSRAKPVRGAK